MPVRPPARLRLTRRALVDRGARLGAGALPLTLAGVTGAAGAACARPAPPPRPLVLLAEHSPDREARVALWNQERAPQRGAPLELRHVPYGAGSADTRAAIAAGMQRPDLIWGDLNDLPPLALGGALAPLAGRVRADGYDLKRFMPAALGPGFGPDGRLVALPDEVDARQLYFNRDHLDGAGLDVRAAGLDFERPAVTWEGLRRVNLDLLAAPAPRERTPYSAAFDGAPLELWGWQNGATWLDRGARRVSFATPEGAGALAWLAAHTRELGNTAGVPEAAQQAVSRHGDAADQPLAHPFLRTAVSVCFESTRLVSTVASWHPGFPLGYVEPPRRAPGHPLVSLSRAWGYALHRDAPDVAWEALTFLLAERAVLAGAAAGAALAPTAPPPDPAAPPPLRPLPTPGRALWFPPYSGQLTIDELLGERHQTGSKTLDEARDHGLEQLRHARFRPPCPAPDAVWPVLAQALREALQGAPPLEALARAQDEAQKRLDGAWKSASSR